MPIYEYQCNQCKHKLEIIQKISDEPLKFCPECGEETLRKLISSVSFRLKGTGWYETDFKNKGKGVETKPGTDSSKSADKSNTAETKTSDKTS